MARVLLILEDWYLGGTEQYVAKLGQYLHEKHQFEVHLAVLHGWEECQLEQARHWAHEIHLLGPRRIPAMINLASVVRRLRPEVCHCHLYTSLLPVTLLLRALRASHLVATLHMPLTAWCRRHRMMWRLAIAMADRIVANSRAVADTLPRGGNIGSGTVNVIPPPISHEARPDRKNTHPFTVVACGRLSREKDWPTLMRAFAAFRSSVDRPVHCVLMGEGPLRAQLQGLLAELGIDDWVELRGAVPHDEVIRALGRASVFVLPSKFEGLGMAALEAMSCAVPTITADFEAASAYIEEGITGNLFPGGNWDALRDLLRWHYNNPMESQMMGEEGQRFVQSHFSEAETLPKYLSVYGLPASEIASLTS